MRAVGASRAGSWANARRTLLLTLPLVLALAACRPLYFPPVPDAPPFEPGVRVVAFEAGLAATGRPRVALVVAGHDAAGWLSVQWMAPTGREAASDSVWLEPVPSQPASSNAAAAEEAGPAAAGSEAVFVLPADVELRPGEWRAVVSFGGRLLRQFTVLVEQVD